MELCLDVARGGIEYKRDSAGVICGDSNVDAMHAAWSPAWKLYVPRDLRIKDINGANPNMNIMKLALIPTRLGKNVAGGQTCCWIWDMVVKENWMGNCNGPQCCVSNIRPLDGGVQPHRLCHRHYCLNCSFRVAVLMMRSNSSREAQCLFQSSHLLRVFGGGKAASII